MILDLELTKSELINLKKGGFITLVLPDGIRIVIVKDSEKDIPHK